MAASRSALRRDASPAGEDSSWNRMRFTATSRPRHVPLYATPNAPRPSTECSTTCDSAELCVSFIFSTAACISSRTSFTSATSPAVHESRHSSESSADVFSSVAPEKIWLRICLVDTGALLRSVSERPDGLGLALGTGAPSVVLDLCLRTPAVADAAVTVAVVGVLVLTLAATAAAAPTAPVELVPEGASPSWVPVIPMLPPGSRVVANVLPEWPGAPPATSMPCPIMGLMSELEVE
mmetsp:Transcript_16652/g.41618  ORF Transcript_16652/g.41618 Transcript_16652/m.41618 type:complete len:237 (+) Transcript_16652:491-1201(+)